MNNEAQFRKEPAVFFERLLSGAIDKVWDLLTNTKLLPGWYGEGIIEARGKEVLLTLTHMPVLDRFQKQNAMGWHTFLDMLEAAVKNETIEERSFYMKRNAERYGIDLANLVR